MLANDVHASVVIEKYLLFNITLIFFWVIVYSSLNKGHILSLIGHFLFREKHTFLKLFSAQQ